MLPTVKLKKLINTDYNELLSRIINRKNYIDSDINNRKICFELFQRIVQKNKHNFKLDQIFNDSLNFCNSCGGFGIYIWNYNKKYIIIHFKVSPWCINTNDKGVFNFKFKSWLKAAQFLIKEKNKYLKMISEFINLNKDEYFVLAKSNSHLKNFEVSLEDRYERILEFVPTEKSKYFGT